MASSSSPWGRRATATNAMSINRLPGGKKSPTQPYFQGEKEVNLGFVLVSLSSPMGRCAIKKNVMSIKLLPDVIKKSNANLKDLFVFDSTLKSPTQPLRSWFCLAVLLGFVVFAVGEACSCDKCHVHQSPSRRKKNVRRNPIFKERRKSPMGRRAPQINAM